MNNDNTTTTFVGKVRRAQQAGAKGVIIALDDDKFEQDLPDMPDDGTGNDIHRDLFAFQNF